MLPRFLLASLLLLSPAFAEERQPWTASQFHGTPDPPPPYQAEQLWDHLLFDRALDIAYLPSEEQIFIVERKGKIWRLPADTSTPNPERTLAADLNEFIPNLFSIYGMTFHPHFAENREVFFFYVDENQSPTGSHIARFRMLKDRLELAPGSQEVLISFGSGGHNGGHLQFGPDGMLYFLVGDLAPPSPPDPLNTGQDLSDLASSVLRIDVDNTDPGLPYRIPPDNPFLEVENARPEIWAYGFRNPWKLCFHPTRGDLWVGDVGWELWELLHLVKRGGNYGWSITEGPELIRPNQSPGPSPITLPAVVHPHTEAASITGGYFYQGDRLPDLRDAYVYGDFVTGKMWALWHDGENLVANEEIADTGLQIVTFGLAGEGEVLFLNWDPPQNLFRLVPNPEPDPAQPFPHRLSETGLFENTEALEPKPGVYPFQIQAPMWQDGATAEHWAAIPGEGSIRARYPQRQNVPLLNLDKPEGTVLAKTLSVAGTRMETQILHYNGFWKAYSYRWNEEQTDAELVPKEGAQASVGGHPWQFPSRAECFRCHSGNFNRLLAFTPGQLQRDDQLDRFAHLGLIQNYERGASFQTLVDPHDESQPAESRARSWLHANCSHCHRISGGGSVAIQMNVQYPAALMNLIDEDPLKGGFGLDAPKLIAPGDPANSVLYYRSATQGLGHMPMIGARKVDPAGLNALREWIEGMGPPPKPLYEAGLDSTSQALHTIGLLDRGQLSDEERKDLLQEAAQSKNPLIPGLFQRFLSSAEESGSP